MNNQIIQSRTEILTLNDKKIIKGDDRQNILSDISKKIKKEEKINVFRIIINCVFSIFVLALVYFVINNYEEKYEMFYFLTIWSFFMNGFYIVSVTAIDLTRLLKNTEYCIKYNNFIRKHYIRICFPFSISIVFLFWMLILLGDEFQYNSRSLWDILINICFHGLQFVFLLYDTLSYPHQVSINKCLDLIIITCMTIVYFIILGFAKYLLDFNPYDFMTMSNVRQIAGAAILIYIGILDGYVVFVLIAGKCFIDKNVNMDKLKEEISRQKNINDKKNKEKKDKEINNIILQKNKNMEKTDIIMNNNKDEENDKKISEQINEINGNNTDQSNKLIIPKVIRNKLKPIQLKKNVNNNGIDEDKKE